MRWCYIVKPWCFNEKGFCCFLTPAKKHSRHWNLHWKERNRILKSHGDHDLNYKSVYINIQLFKFYKSPTWRKSLSNIAKLKLKLWFFWSNKSCQINVIKVTHRTCPSVFIHGLTYKAWRRRCWVNITSHEQEWWRQSRASSTSKKWAVVICYESLQVER